MTDTTCACTCDYDSVTGDFYEYLCDWCCSSADWEIQKNTVEDLIQAIFKQPTAKEAYAVLMKLMQYLMTIPAFLQENTAFRDGFCELLRILKTEGLPKEHVATLAKFEHFLTVICYAPVACLENT